MRVLRVVFWIFFLVGPALASDLKIRVLDPNSNPVANAQVSVYRAAESTPLALQSTGGDGMVALSGFSDGSYRLEVLAPGFASRAVDLFLPQPSTFTVGLEIAGASEIVVVTATRTPLPEQESGASISTLESGELQAMQPVAAGDALRFLPGAVVNTVGQRGGQSSLFVRGGDSR